MAQQAEMKLWYKRPAPLINDGHFARQNDHPMAGWEKWSLPLGNSYFGVSVFGRIETERLQITENSVCNPGLWGTLWKDGNGGLRTFGDIYIDTLHTDVENYERGLSLDTATAFTSYDLRGITYKKEYFVSYPDRILAVRFTAKKDGEPVQRKISFDVRLDIPFINDYCIREGDGCGRTGKIFTDGERLIMRGVSLYYDIQTEGQARVQTVGGTVSYTNRAIQVRDADEALLLFTCGTNYQMESRVFTETDPKKKLAPYPHPHEKVKAIMDAAYAKTYEALYEAHLADYKRLFDGVKLNIGYDPADLEKTTYALVFAYRRQHILHNT